MNAKQVISKIETVRESLEAEDQMEYINSTYEDYYIFGVDAYIHSGVVLSLANSRDFPDRQWDVSTTGYILVDKKLANELELDITIKSKYPEEEDKARYLAEGLIETWNQYLSGEVYGYQVVKETTCECCNSIKEEFLDSCWGFYSEEECKEQGQFALDGFNKHLEV